MHLYNHTPPVAGKLWKASLFLRSVEPSLYRKGISVEKFLELSPPNLTKDSWLKKEPNDNNAPFILYSTQSRFIHIGSSRHFLKNRRGNRGSERLNKGCLRGCTACQFQRPGFKSPLNDSD